MTTIVFCSNIDYVTIIINIIIRHYNYKLIKHFYCYCSFTQNVLHCAVLVMIAFMFY